MPAISQKLRGLIGGVSQQPDSLKLDGQFRECDNFYPDPTFGLIKRPGTQFIQKLANVSAGDSSWFFICKGLNEKLLLQITKAGAVKLWDAQSGVPYTVNTPSASATTYATHEKFDDLKVLQINDYIFILNRTILVTDDGLTAPSITPYAYISIDTIVHDTEYVVVLDGTSYVYSSHTAPSSGFSIQDVINGLISAIPSATYTATGVGSNIHIERVDGADFSVEARGGTAGTAIKAYKGSVSGVEALPSTFLNNKIIEVAGSDINGKDDYFLKFQTSDGSSAGAGIWIETIAPGAELGVDATTMPHALIREADGTYTFRELSESAASSYVTSTSVNGIPTDVSVTSNGAARWNVGQTFSCYGGTGQHLRLRVTSTNASRQITGVAIERAGQDYTAADVVNNLEGDTFTINTVATQTLPGTTWATQYWQQRQVGDENSNLSPSFIDSYITGISFFKNRLVLMSNENIICSVAGEFLNFYAGTVITAIDSDPIDLSAGAVTRIEFRDGIQESTGLILFADNSQYILQTRTEAFSPATAELNLITSYSHSIDIPPVDLGGSVVVLEENNTSVAVNQLNIKASTVTAPNKIELSKIIPSYIPNEVHTTLNSLSVSLMGILTDREPKSIYLFRYYTQENERLLASWCRWTFPADILMCEFHEDEIFIVLNTDDGPVICHSELMTETPGGAILFEDKYIDLRLDLFDYYPSKSYVAADKQTKIFLKEGARISDGTVSLVKISTNDSGYATYPTVTYDAAAPAGQKYYVTVDGDQTAEEYAIGYQITSEARFPGFYIKRENIADETNIPVVHRVRLFSYESGPFEVELNVPGRNQFTLTLPQITANLNAANQVPMIRTADNTIPIMTKGTDIDLKIICNAPFPLALVSLEWEGTYNNKGIKRI
jgi:hypothetical protein